jgi:phosphomannomutase
VCKWPKQSGQMVTFYLENAVVTLRTSGTEPKIKYYAEIILPPQADGRGSVFKKNTFHQYMNNLPAW